MKTVKLKYYCSNKYNKNLNLLFTVACSFKKIVKPNLNL